MLTRLSRVVFLFSCYLGLWLFGGSAELAWSRMTQGCSNSRCWLLTWSWWECLKSPLCDLSAWEQGSEMEYSKCVKMESIGLFRPSHGSSYLVTSAAFYWSEQVTRENASVIQWLGLHTFTAEGLHWPPGREAKRPQAKRPKNKAPRTLPETWFQGLCSHRQVAELDSVTRLTQLWIGERNPHLMWFLRS